MKTIFTLSILIFFFASLGFAQGVGDLQGSAAGKRALAYFAAFNSGDDGQLAAFFRENTDDEALKRRAVEPRVAFHKQVRSDFKSFTVKTVDVNSPSQIKVTAQGGSGGWASITFQIEGSGKFAGVAVEQIDPPGAKTDAVSSPATIAELAPAIDRLMSGLAASDAFSGVVLVAKDDKPVFSKAYGFSDANKNVLNNVDTKFNLGSINKMFTRIAIGQLAAQGKLSFDDKLIKVLPDYPNKAVAEKITIGQIVSMKSGLGDFFNEKFAAADKSRIRSLQDYLRLFVNDPLEFEPGTRNRYSNAGYLVLGLVIEKLSGMTYYDYVEKNIFKPAGMTNTGYFTIDALPANTAIGYTSSQSSAAKRGPNTPSLPGRGSSAGGGYSNAADMLRFAGALRTRKLQIPDDNGAFPTEFSGVGIAGGSPGVNAVFSSSAKSGFTVVILSNFDPPSAEKPESTLRGWLQQIKQ